MVGCFPARSSSVKIPTIATNVVGSTDLIVLDFLGLFLLVASF